MQSAATQLTLFPPESEKPGQSPGFSVRESGRAKRLSIKVFPRGRVEVVVPRRTGPREVRAFVSENQAWIERARASFAAEHPPEAFELPNLIPLPAIDTFVRVRYLRRSEATSVSYNYSRDVLTLKGQYGAAEPLIQESLSIRRELYGEAHADIAESLEALGLNIYDQGNVEEAVIELRAAIDMRRSAHSASASTLRGSG